MKVNEYRWPGIEGEPLDLIADTLRFKGDFAARGWGRPHNNTSPVNHFWNVLYFDAAITGIALDPTQRYPASIALIVAGKLQGKFDSKEILEAQKNVEALRGMPTTPLCLCMEIQPPIFVQRADTLAIDAGGSDVILHFIGKHSIK